jgi:hypothetical protein
MGQALMDSQPNQSVPTGWYHCGGCGEVFPGGLGEHAPTACGSCGKGLRRATSAAGSAAGFPKAGVMRDMQMLARRPPLDQPASTTGRQAPRTITATRVNDVRQRSEPRRSPKALLLGIFLLAWLVGLIFLGVHMQRGPTPVAAVDDAPVGRTPEEVVLLRAALPKCQRAWYDFLRAGTPEARAQSVRDGYLVVGAMQRHYAENPALNLTVVPVLRYSGALETSAGTAIETLWETPDQQYEVVFFEQNGEWRMDWKHFVRYSEMPWALYLAGVGEDVGEFRLYVRERQGSAGASESLRVVFYLPKFGSLNEYGPQSPEIAVPRDSQAGRRLAAALAGAQADGAYHSKLTELDPKGMARVRARVRRIEEGGKRRFEVEEVLAGHWLDLSNAGIDPEATGNAPETPGR